MYMRRRGALLLAPALVLVLLATLAAIAAVPSYGVRVGVEAGEVFSLREVVPPGHVMMFSFVMDADFVFPVRALDQDTNDLMRMWTNTPHGFFNIGSEKKELRLVLEFDNSQSMLTLMNVNFDISILPDLDHTMRADQIDPIERKIQSLSKKMHTVRHLQEALRYKQKNHRATVEGVWRQMFLWSILQIVGFVVVLGGQLWLFQSVVEKRRTV